MAPTRFLGDPWPEALAAGLVDAECADEDLRKTAFQKAGSCLGNLAHLANFTPASYAMMKKELYTDAYPRPRTSSCDTLESKIGATVTVCTSNIRTTLRVLCTWGARSRQTADGSAKVPRLDAGCRRGPVRPPRGAPLSRTLPALLLPMLAQNPVGCGRDFPALAGKSGKSWKFMIVHNFPMDVHDVSSVRA